MPRRLPMDRAWLLLGLNDLRALIKSAKSAIRRGARRDAEDDLGVAIEVIEEVIAGAKD